MICEHGTYVGGSGIDWMCGWCEDGVSRADYLRARGNAYRYDGERALNHLLLVVQTGVSFHQHMTPAGLASFGRTASEQAQYHAMYLRLGIQLDEEAAHAQ